MQADVTPEVGTRLVEKRHREEQHCEAALHVGGTAPVDLPVKHLGPKGVKVPAGEVAHRNHVHVTVKDNAEALVRANVSVDYRVVLARVGNQALRLDAVAREVAPHKVDRRLLRVQRALVLYANEVLAERDKLILAVEDLLVKLFLRNR